MHPRTRRSAVVASLSLLPLLLAGCAAGVTRGPGSSPLPDLVTGNWQVNSTAPVAAHLSSVSGTLSGTSAAMTGIFHTQAASACIAPSKSFELSGSADKAGNVSLSGPLANGTLTLTGTLAADGKSLEDASYTVAGGSCAFNKPADATAEVYTPISGMYTGTFSDSDGQIASVQATLNQSADANGDGNYTLSGSATPNNPCFTGTVPISNTQVTGGTFTFTYTDPNTTNSVTATGTFSSDASTLNVTQWTLSGPCGPDSGTGSMARQ